MLLPLVFRSVKKQGKTPSLPSLNSRGKLVILFIGLPLLQAIVHTLFGILGL